MDPFSLMLVLFVAMLGFLLGFSWGTSLPDAPSDTEDTFTLRISDPDASAALYAYAWNAEAFGRHELAEKMYQMSEDWQAECPEEGNQS